MAYRAEVITLPNVGTAGTYSYPNSITTDPQGRVTAVGSDWTSTGYSMAGNITIADDTDALRSKTNTTFKARSWKTGGVGAVAFALDTQASWLSGRLLQVSSGGTPYFTVSTDGALAGPGTSSGGLYLFSQGAESVQCLDGLVALSYSADTYVAKVDAGAIGLDGGVWMRRAGLTNDYPITGPESVIFGQQGTGKIVTLPSISSVSAGQIIIVADEAGTATAIDKLTIRPYNGTEKINGSAGDRTIESANGCICLYATSGAGGAVNTDWIILFRAGGGS